MIAILLFSDKQPVIMPPPIAVRTFRERPWPVLSRANAIGRESGPTGNAKLYKAVEGPLDVLPVQVGQGPFHVRRRPESLRRRFARLA